MQRETRTGQHYKRRSRFLVIFLVMGAFVVGLGIAAFYAIDMTAEAEPSWPETRLAQAFLDAKLRTSGARKPPLPVTENDLDKAVGTYEQQCSFCHGATRGKAAPFAKSLSPRPPQFTIQPSRGPTWMDAYVIQHGIRWSGMPAFHGLSEADAWRLALYVEGQTQAKE